MSTLVADTSGLVSLGVAARRDPDPLARCFSTYDVQVPEPVVEELQAISSRDDVHGTAAGAVIDRDAELTVRSVTIDQSFPLDDGENAAVTLANEIEAELFLCDEFNRLGLIHASLAGPRLVTTPTLLAVFLRTGVLTREEALGILDVISQGRSWEANSYVQRSRSLLERD